MSDDTQLSVDKQVELFFQAAVQDIRDTKVRPWNFLTVLVVVIGGVLSINRDQVPYVRHLLFIGVFLAAGSTAFMSISSFRQLTKHRKRLKRIYEHMKHADQHIRGARDEVTKPDFGDWFFAVIGVLVPLIALLVAFCHFFQTGACRFTLCG